jgi:MFS transporter, PPP family, 3-phenylpropionic acid transporter
MRCDEHHALRHTTPAATVWKLRLYYLMYLAALGGFSPFFGLYAVSRGFSDWQVSVLMSLWYLTRVFAPSAWNAGVERSTQPIQWLRAGAVLCFAFTALFLLPHSFASLVVVMILFSSSFNALMPQFETLTLMQLRDQPERYSGIRVWGSVGFLLTVTGFGVLFRHIGVNYLIFAMLPLIAGLIYASLVNRYPDQHAPQHRDTTHAAAVSSANPLRHRGFAILLLIMACNQIAHGPLHVYFGIYLQRYGFDEQINGGLWGIGVAAEILAFVLMRGWLQKLSPERLLGLALMIGVVRWSVTAQFPQHLWLLALMQLGHAFTFAAIHAAGMQLMSQWFNAAQMGKAQSLMYGLASGIGGVLGALLAGLAWRYINPNASFWMAAFFSLLALAVRPALRKTPKT